MRASVPVSLVVALAFAALLAAAPSRVRAQGDLPTGPTRPAPVAPRPAPAAPPRGARAAVVTKKVVVAPQVGTLTIIAESNARVILKKLPNGDVVYADVEAGERGVIVTNLRPGQYQVSAELDGYKSAQEGPILVRPGKADKVELRLTPLTYDVTVSLNAPAGQVFYAKGNEPPRVVRFENSRIVLKGLAAGQYNVRIEPDDSVYQAQGFEVVMPRDAGGTLTRKLENHLSTQDFALISASDWVLPAGWRFAAGALTVNGRGLALPQAADYRYYRDFQITADVKMVNGVAASFGLRASDPQNYYLIQLTGANADERYMLRGFIVKAGVAEPFGRRYSISSLADTLKQDKSFNVLIKMRGNRIEVFVTDSETANSEYVGVLEDPEQTFKIGAAGIAARDSERVVVGSFNICATKCPGS